MLRVHSRPTVFLTVVCVVALVVSNARAESAPAPAKNSGNAAVIYWQAFAVMPSLNDADKDLFRTATKSTDAPLSKELEPLVARYAESLAGLHRAASFSTCDWLLDYSQGPQLLLPHLQKSRELSRVALLRARLRFQSGNTDGAVADAMASMNLARDCGSTPLIISMLVGAALEKSATEVLVASLTDLTPEQLEQLAGKLKSLPATASLAESLVTETQSFGRWLARLVDSAARKLNDPEAGGKLLAVLHGHMGLNLEEPKGGDKEWQRRKKLIDTLTVEDVRTMLKRLNEDYAEMTRIARLSQEEQAKGWPEFDAGLAESRKLRNRDDLLRLFSVLFLPSAAKANGRISQNDVMRDMLLAAVLVRRHGAAALQSDQLFLNPGIKHHMIENGFELHYQYAGTDKTETLRIVKTNKRTQ